jgi:hypothetical protein
MKWTRVAFPGDPAIPPEDPKVTPDLGNPGDAGDPGNPQIEPGLDDPNPHDEMGLPGPQPTIEDPQPIDVFIETQRRLMESMLGQMKTENVGEDMIQAQRDQQTEMENILRQKKEQGYQFAGMDEHGEEVWASQDQQNWESVFRFE